MSWGGSASLIFSSGGGAPGIVRRRVRSGKAGEPRLVEDGGGVGQKVEPNAYADGGHSVAVTTGGSGRFSSKDPYRSRSQRAAGPRAWPSRARCNPVLAGHDVAGRALALSLAAGARLALRLSGRQPGRLLAAVVAVTVVVAVVQAVQRHQLLIAGVLAALALCGVVCPLADAALSRRDEFAADRFAAQAGYGAALTGALHRLDVGQQHQGRPLLERALARHPSVETRLDALHDLPADEGIPR